jgi:hypothetical protein
MISPYPSARGALLLELTSLDPARDALLEVRAPGRLRFRLAQEPLLALLPFELLDGLLGLTDGPFGLGCRLDDGPLLLAVPQLQ